MTIRLVNRSRRQSLRPDGRSTEHWPPACCKQAAAVILFTRILLQRLRGRRLAS